MIELNKTNCLFFDKKNDVSATKGKLEAASLKEKVKLFQDLFIACQRREGDLDQFFRHKNHDFPPSLSEYGTLC